MTDSQAAALAERPEVVPVSSSQLGKLHTTYSWEYLYLGYRHQKLWDVPDKENLKQENVIIGIIDSGIWPESTSFNPSGMSQCHPVGKDHASKGNNSTLPIATGFKLQFHVDPNIRISVQVFQAEMDECSDADVLAGIDSAIRDGVDIINLSVGTSRSVKSYLHDPIALAAFHAVLHGVLVVGSAGNSGICQRGECGE